MKKNIIFILFLSLLYYPSAFCEPEGSGGSDGSTQMMMIGMALVAPIAGAFSQIITANIQKNEAVAVTQLKTDAQIKMTEMQTAATGQIAALQEKARESDRETTQYVAKMNQDAATTRLQMQLDREKQAYDEYVAYQMKLKELQLYRENLQTALEAKKNEQEQQLLSRAFDSQLAQTSLKGGLGTDNLSQLVASTLGTSIPTTSSSAQASANPLSSFLSQNQNSLASQAAAPASSAKGILDAGFFKKIRYNNTASSNPKFFRKTRLAR